MGNMVRPDGIKPPSNATVHCFDRQTLMVVMSIWPLFDTPSEYRKLNATEVSVTTGLSPDVAERTLIQLMEDDILEESSHEDFACRPYVSVEYVRCKARGNSTTIMERVALDTSKVYRLPTLIAAAHASVDERGRLINPLIVCRTNLQWTRRCLAGQRVSKADLQALDIEITRLDRAISSYKEFLRRET